MQISVCRAILLVSLAVFPPLAEAGAPLRPQGVTYVIPIKDVIDSGLLYVIRRGVAEAGKAGAGAIVFDVDTPGGRVDVTEEIINTLGSVQVPTYTFVNPNAISAGAIIAMATDHIYMAPGARIGDAMPLMVSPFGSVEEMSEATREKMVSYVAALIRSQAQRRNHDPKLAEAMVRRESGYKVGDEVICPTGQLLTLTSQDAERRAGSDNRPLLSEGTAGDLHELLRKIGREDTRVVRLEVTGAERVARWIEALSVLLLAGGLLGLYIEFKTPGFGLPGILGFILLAIWFWGHHIAGLAGMEEIVLFIIGAILVLVEVLVIPGFGLAGVAGIAMMIVAVVLSMVEHYPGGPWCPSLGQLQSASVQLGSSLLIMGAAALLIGRYLPGTPIFRRLILSKATDRASGFQSSEETGLPVGTEGMTVNELRPSGTGLFGDRRIDVMTRGDFVKANTRIRIAEVRGSRVVVEPVSGEAPRPLESKPGNAPQTA